MSIREQGGSYHYRFMLQGKRYFGVCHECSTKKTAEAFERDVKKTQKGLLAQKTVKALVENYRDELTGGATIPIAEAFELSLMKPRKRQAQDRLVEMKRSYWRDFHSYLKGEYPDFVNLSDVTQKATEEYIARLRKEGRYDKTVTMASKPGRKRKASGEAPDEFAGISYERKHNLSPKTVNTIHNALAEVFTLLHKDAGLLENPFAHIEKTADAMQEREAFTDEELKMIFERAGKVDPFIYELFAIGVSTGLREADICLLKWDEVNLVGGYIYRTTRKTGRKVEIPILPPLRNFLLSQKERTGAGVYVLPAHAEMYTKNHCGISWRVKTFLESVGINPQKQVEGRTRAVSVKDVHSLRHSFATAAAVHGVPLAVVRDILGHMTEEMTRRYQNHIDRQTKVAALSKMPIYLPTDARQLPPSEEIAAVPLPIKTSDDRLRELREYLETTSKISKEKILAIINAQETIQ